MIDTHAEFKDTCQELETRIEEIAVDLRDLPTDYKLAEKYAEIDREICEVSEWYDSKKQELINIHKRYWKERNAMEAAVRISAGAMSRRERPFRLDVALGAADDRDRDGAR